MIQLRQFRASPPGASCSISTTPRIRFAGARQLSLFNAHYDSRCFQPIHTYEATTGKPVAIVLPARPRTGSRTCGCSRN
jgi:hypothetical protein